MSQSRKMTPGVSPSFRPPPPPEMHWNLTPQSVVQDEDMGSTWELVGNAHFQAHPPSPELESTF